jgi:hypothetical protein
MFKRISVSMAAALVSFAAGVSAQTTEPADSFKVDYFSSANCVNMPDGNVRITNVGTSKGAGNPSGDMLVGIFVFDPNQELTECCACQITPDGLLTLSINNDLTSNPLTGNILTSGVIKLAGFSRSMAFTLAPGIRAWATHIQASGATTETAFSDATLSVGEFNNLIDQCVFIFEEGSGAGQCGCGNTVAGRLFH